MKENLAVEVVYRNERLEPVYTKRYGLGDYTEMLRQDLLRVITDVEALAYEASGNAAKSDWPDEVWRLFSRIKHKLLDKAGDIGRLPENLREGAPHKGEPGTLSSLVAEMVDAGG